MKTSLVTAQETLGRQSQCGRRRARSLIGSGGSMTTTRTHFTFRIDTWTPDGESVVEHVAGVEDYQIALATYRAACERWPSTPITLCQGSRVIEDSRRLRLAWIDKGGRRNFAAGLLASRSDKKK
jgi:hypothetical protein